MSAINPASFASPTLGIQAPSGVGPGAVVNRGSAAASRRQDSQQDSQSSYAGSGQAGRGAQSTFQAAAPIYPGSSYAYNPYGAFGNAARAGAMPYTPSTPDPFAGPFAQGGDYAGRARFPNPQAASVAQHDQTLPGLGAQPDLFTSFQGLSLNSRS